MFPTVTTSNSTPIKKISQISHLIAHRNLINKKIKNLLNWIDVLRLQDFSTIKQINRRGEREYQKRSDAEKRPWIISKRRRRWSAASSSSSLAFLFCSSSSSSGVCGWDWPIYAKTKQVCIEVWSRCFCCCCCEYCDFVIWFVRFLYCLWFFFFFFMSNLEVWKFLVCLRKLQRNTAGLALLHTQIAAERKIERERERERGFWYVQVQVQLCNPNQHAMINCLLIFFDETTTLVP